MLTDPAIAIWNKADINHRINIKARLALLRNRPTLVCLIYRNLMADDMSVGDFCDNIYRWTGRSVVELAQNEKPCGSVRNTIANEPRPPYNQAAFNDHKKPW